MIKRLESLPCEKRQNELGLFSLEKTLEGPYHSIPALKGLLQGEWRLSLLKEPHGEDKEQRLQGATGKVRSPHKKEIPWSETHLPLGQLPCGCGGDPIAAGFWDARDRVPSIHSFPTPGWTRRALTVPSNQGGSVIPSQKNPPLPSDPPSDFLPRTRQSTKMDLAGLDGFGFHPDGLERTFLCRYHPSR